MPGRPTPIASMPASAVRRVGLRRVVPRHVVLRLAVLVLAGPAAGLAAAPAALAVEDLSRPVAEVLQGPSCHPGGVVVEVTAGTAPYTVVLATTRHPEGEDEAALAPGQTALLRTGDVDWGETIDSRLDYAAQDGSGVTYVDELAPFTFTRPSQEDCAAIGATTGGAPATVPTPLVVPVSPGAGLDPAPDAEGSPTAADPSPATGGTADGAAEDTATPAVGTGGGGADLQLQPTAVVAPVTRTVEWPAALAGGALVATAGGLLVTGLRRRAGARRGGPPAGA